MSKKRAIYKTVVINALSLEFAEELMKSYVRLNYTDYVIVSYYLSAYIPRNTGSQYIFKTKLLKNDK